MPLTSLFKILFLFLLLHAGPRPLKEEDQTPSPVTVVIDMSYDKYMQQGDIIKIIKQVGVISISCHLDSPSLHIILSSNNKRTH